MVYARPIFHAAPKPSASTEELSIVIVGAGLVGLTLALDLGRRGIRTVVVDEDTTVADGSRAIVFARRSLEIFARLGLGERILQKGVAWDNGTIFLGDKALLSAKIVDDPQHEYPLFLNIQQYYLEEWLVEACLETGFVELRWGHRLHAVRPVADHALLDISTPDGSYFINTRWLVACDGASSFVRKSLDLPFVGRVFKDRFLIADVRFDTPLPAERRFWFGPSFHPGRCALLHKQPDDIWRVDFQLGWDADPVIEREPERVQERLRRMFGDDTPVEFVWASVYTFQSRRLKSFVHGPIIFAGDSAHQVSPFGGRGGNGGIQDADNLGWKVAAVLRGEADANLIDSYDDERCFAADENILHSTRSAEFITPKSPGAEAYRDAVLRLATKFPFARQMINSGRLSMPAHLSESPLNYSYQENPVPALLPGSPAADAPLRNGHGQDWFLRHLRTNGFSVVRRSRDAEATISISDYPQSSHPRVILADSEGHFTRRYGLRPGDILLFRPDQHLAARLSEEQATLLPAAYAKAVAKSLGGASCP